MIKIYNNRESNCLELSESTALCPTKVTCPIPLAIESSIFYIDKVEQLSVQQTYNGKYSPMLSCFNFSYYEILRLSRSLHQALVDLPTNSVPPLLFRPFHLIRCTNEVSQKGSDMHLHKWADRIYPGLMSRCTHLIFIVLHE